MQTGQNQAAAAQTVTAEISVDLGSTNSQIAVKITGDSDGKILAGRTTAKKGKTVRDFFIKDGLCIDIPTKYIRRDEWPDAPFDWGNDEIYFGSKAVDAYNSAYGDNRGVLRGEFKSELYFSMEDKEDPDIRKRYERACESTETFLKYLHTLAEEEISVYSGRISKRITYVTVPNRSSNEDKKKMKELAQNAGFQNVQIMEEAESALRYVIADSCSALRKAFGNMKEIKPLYVILMDIGGSTADLLTVKLVPSPDRLEGYEIHILGMWPETGEKDTLGGLDVDRAIKDYMVKKGYLLPGIVDESIKWRGYFEFEKFKKWINHKLLKGEIIGRAGKLLNYSLHRHGGILFRLSRKGILVVAKAIPVTPGHIMGGKKQCKIRRVDIQQVTITHDPGGLPGIAVRNAKTPPLIVHESVKGNTTFRAKVKQQIKTLIQLGDHIGTAAHMLILGYAKSPVVGSILFVTPVQSSMIQVSHIPEDASSEEVVLYETDKTLYLPFGKGMTGLTELRLETHGLHELLVILLPSRRSVLVSTDDHTLHIVC